MTLEAWLRVTTEGRWPGHTEACIPVPIYPWSAPLPAPILCPPSPFTFEETRLPSSSGRLGKVTGRHILRPLAKNNEGWKGKSWGQENESQPVPAGPGSLLRRQMEGGLVARQNSSYSAPPMGEAGAEGRVCLLSSSTLSPKALQAMSFLEPLTGLKTHVFSVGALKGPDCVLSTTHVTYKPCPTEHRGHRNRSWDFWWGHKPLVGSSCCLCLTSPGLGRTILNGRER